MSMSFNLSGFSQLHARLQTLSDVEATKAGQAAVRAGGALLARKIKEAAPVSNVPEGKQITRHNKNGSTRMETHYKIVNHIKVKKIKTQGGKVEVSVGVVKGYHVKFVEMGSIHNAANPFMKNAFEANTQEVIDKMGQMLGKQLVKRGA